MSARVDREGQILVVTLERQAKRNAIDEETASDIDAALNHLEDEAGLRAAVITGGTEIFSAGSDLKHGSGAPTPRGGEYGIIKRKALKPLIAAVEGLAYGGGMEIVLSCDLVVASSAARFGLPEIKHGLLAAYGGVFRSARALPLNIAKEIVLTGDPISAERAAQFGLVNILSQPGQALQEAIALANRVVANAPISVRESLRILEESAAESERVGWAAMLPAMEKIIKSEDSVEGRASFFEKREPVWKDR